MPPCEQAQYRTTPQMAPRKTPRADMAMIVMRMGSSVFSMLPAPLIWFVSTKSGYSVISSTEEGRQIRATMRWSNAPASPESDDKETYGFHWDDPLAASPLGVCRDLPKERFKWYQWPKKNGCIRPGSITGYTKSSPLHSVMLSPLRTLMSSTAISPQLFASIRLSITTLKKKHKGLTLSWTSEFGAIWFALQKSKKEWFRLTWYGLSVSGTRTRPSLQRLPWWPLTVHSRMSAGPSTICLRCLMCSVPMCDPNMWYQKETQRSESRDVTTGLTSRATLVSWGPVAKV